MNERVLVVVDRAWQSFEQVAAAVQRRGLPVVYVGVGLHRHSALMRRAAFRRSVFLDDLTPLPGVLRSLAGDTVVDILCPEPDLPAVLAAAEAAELDEALLDQLSARLVHADKVSSMQRVRDLGLPTPRSVPSSTDPDEAAAELGWPLVVKGRRGAGGLAVRIAHDADETRTAVREVAAMEVGDVYLEEHLGGDNINYAAIYDHGTVRAECCFVSLRSHTDTRLPGTSLVLTDDPLSAQIGRGIAADLPGIGILDAEVMRDGDRAAVIDVNVRPFGSVLALGGAGADLVGAYADAVAGRPVTTAAATPPADGRAVTVFPTSSEQLVPVDLTAAARDYRRALPGAVRDLGPAYAAVASLAFVLRWGKQAARTVASGARRRLPQNA